MATGHWLGKRVSFQVVYVPNAPLDRLLLISASLVQEHAQVRAVDHSLLLGRVTETIYLSIHVILNLLSWSSAGH